VSEIHDTQDKLKQLAKVLGSHCNLSLSLIDVDIKEIVKEFQNIRITFIL